MSFERPPSQTAVLVSMLRAAHLHLDEEPHIFRDTLALGLSGLDGVERLRMAVDGLMARFGADIGAEPAARLMAGVRSTVAWRARSAEDRLLACASRGIDQCVVLGAGLDSTAYRLHEILPSMRFFEVDHAASQAWKRERLAAMGVAAPRRLRYVAVDFERDDVFAALQAAGMVLDRPVVLIWLGVSYYLEPETTFGVIEAFARLAPSSELVMDYIVPPARWTPGMAAMMSSMRRLTSESSEPMFGFLEPDQLAAQASSAGLQVLSDIGEEDRVGWLKGRHDGLALALLADEHGPARVLNLTVPARA